MVQKGLTFRPGNSLAFNQEVMSFIEDSCLGVRVAPCKKHPLAPQLFVEGRSLASGPKVLDKLVELAREPN